MPFSLSLGIFFSHINLLQNNIRKNRRLMHAICDSLGKKQRIIINYASDENRIKKIQKKEKLNARNEMQGEERNCANFFSRLIHDNGKEKVSTFVIYHVHWEESRAQNAYVNLGKEKLASSFFHFFFRLFLYRGRIFFCCKIRFLFLSFFPFNKCP